MPDEEPERDKRLSNDPHYIAELDPSRPIELAWIIKFIKNTIEERSRKNNEDADIADLAYWNSELDDLCKIINRRQSSIGIADIYIHHLFIGALETGFAIGSLLKGEAEIIRKIQSKYAREGVRKRNLNKNWSEIARKKAISIMRDGKARTANRLAEDVLEAWDYGRCPVGNKTMAGFIQIIAAEPDCPFCLKVDGRSKKR